MLMSRMRNEANFLNQDTPKITIQKYVYAINKNLIKCIQYFIWFDLKIMSRKCLPDDKNRLIFEKMQ